MKKTLSAKKRFQTFSKYLDAAINAFSLTFFIVSLFVWTYLTVLNIATHPFTFALLWEAFNAMYGQISFKVGCIILIIFNGLQVIQGYFGYYHTFKESHKHLTTLAKIVKNNSHKQ